MGSFAGRIFQRFRGSARPISAACGTAATGVYLSSPLLANEPKKTQLVVPKYTSDGDRYDQTNFEGRLTGILDRIDPRTLFITDDELDKAQKLIDDFDKSGYLAAGVTDADMWDAKRKVEACIHPVTKEKMFVLGRMSAFVPMNVPICFGMLTFGGSPAGVIFWQWVNQSYNVMTNYVNRSSSKIELQPLLQSYGLAVFTSCAIALRAGTLFKAVPSCAGFGPFIPDLAVISAGSCNVAFTRMHEITHGIPIFDRDGKELGISKKAGERAVLQTIATRSCILPIPVLLVPPLVMKMVPFTGVAAVLFQTGVITCCISLGLPIVLSLQPQQMTIDVTHLEQKFQGLTDSAGAISQVFANKGL
eukprot:gene681-418_t